MEALQEHLQIEERTVTFVFLDSKDKCLDNIFYIKQLFEWDALNRQQRLRVLNYLIQEAEAIPDL